MANSEARGIDPSVAVGLPPSLKDDAEVKARYVVARFASQNDHFVGFFKSWTKTLNFLIGEQWRTRWDGTSLTWNAERDIPEWRQQPVTNYTYAVYRAAQAKLTKQKPTLEVVPPSGNSEDKEAAELGNALLTYLWRLLKKPAKLPIAIGWILITGMAYLRVGYNPDGGEARARTVPVPRARQPLGAPDDDSIEADTDTESAANVPRGTSTGALPAVGGGEAVAPSSEPPENGTAGQPQMPPSSGDGSTPDDMEEVDVAADENGEPYRTPDGEIDWDRKPDMEQTGEIDFGIVSPLSVRLNPEATSHDDATEMFVATLWPKNKAAKHFGLKDAELVGGDESAEQIALYTDMVSATTAGMPRSWQDRASNWGVDQRNAIGARILVIEYYADRSDDFPEGRHWITAGSTKVWPPESKAQAKLADKKQVAGEYDDAEDGQDAPIFPDGEAPLPFGFWPPLIPILDTPIPGQPTSAALLGQIVGLNEQLNFLDAKIAEHHVMMAMGGALIVGPADKDIKMTSEPGQIIVSIEMGRRGQAFAPFQMDMKALPAEVYREREVINAKIQAISGMSGPDLTQKPEGVPSGRSLLVTQETSDATIMPLLQAIEFGLQEAGRRELVIAQQKYREERIISIRQTDGKYIYRAFKGADLRDGHDVRVELGSSFPWSKSAQMDAKMALITAVPGLFTNPQTGEVDAVKLAKIMDSGAPGLESFESTENDDLIEINREHDMFETYDPSPDGSHQLPQIAFWQNSPIHLKEHYNFMKRDLVRFSKWHPAAQEAFKTHMMLTQVAVEDAAEQMMGPAPQPGGAAGPGAASPSPGAAPAGGPPAPGGPAGPSGPQLVRNAPPPPQLVRPGQQPPGAALTPSDFASARP